MNAYKLISLSATWLLVTACSAKGDDSGAGTGGASGSCTPDTTHDCLGPGACDGVQVCNSDGTGWGACDCSGAGTGGGTGGGGQLPPQTTIECTTAADAGGFTFERIGVWRDDATAAYTMFHDDFCDYGCRGVQENAVPALEAHGLTAGLGAIVSECESANLWDVVLDSEARGNEIMNHSYTHPEITPANADSEVVQAKATLDAQLANPVTFFIYPYDFFTSESIAAVGAAGHIGSRGGDRDDNDGTSNPPINPNTPTNDLEVEFDAWPRTYSKYARFASPGFLNVHVYNAIEREGWATREFHSVIPDGTPEEGNGFGPIYLSDYNAHLDFLVDAWKANEVWTAPPSAVINYRRARSACTASVSGSTITYGTSSADCTAYATPISVIVSTANDVASVQAMQGGTAVSSRKIAANTFSITADPTQGSVELSGCADADPAEVDGSVQLAPKPEPAGSVCELQQVVGTGSDGSMDDLEFSDPSEFQALPNGRQADGRDGSWSWYPMGISVTVEDDGTGNHAIHYVAGGLGIDQYSGVTLAFLGGNGAGACYDASAYTGVQFRIKGTASADDKGWGLADIVTVSLVTAATQPTTWGGDAEQEIGHFHSNANIAAAATDWITVQIPFDTSLLGPWSGQGPSSLPVDQLQAIDWGLQSGQSLDIWIDDIELY